VLRSSGESRPGLRMPRPLLRDYHGHEERRNKLFNRPPRGSYTLVDSAGRVDDEIVLGARVAVYRQYAEGKFGPRLWAAGSEVTLSYSSDVQSCADLRELMLLLGINTDAKWFGRYAVTYTVAGEGRQF
jgi:hypothetical protein